MAIAKAEALVDGANRNTATSALGVTVVAITPASTSPVVHLPPSNPSSSPAPSPPPSPAPPLDDNGGGDKPCFSRETSACRLAKAAVGPAEAFAACFSGSDTGHGSRLRETLGTSVKAERVLMTELRSGDLVLSDQAPPYCSHGRGVATAAAAAAAVAVVVEAGVVVAGSGGLMASQS